MEEFLIILGIAFVPVTAALTALWFSERAHVRRAEEALYDMTSGTQPRHRSPSNAEIAAALESMSRDIERISEAQRFTAQVLAERHERIVAQTPLRPITPH